MKNCVKCENDLSVENDILSFNLKNFQFKSFNLIKQNHFGYTDLIRMNIKLFDS
jgi:hypothetical protein